MSEGLRQRETEESGRFKMTSLSLDRDSIVMVARNITNPKIIIKEAESEETFTTSFDMKASINIRLP